MSEVKPTCILPQRHRLALRAMHAEELVVLRSCYCGRARVSPAYCELLAFEQSLFAS